MDRTEDNIMDKPALLMLDDGACFEGKACGVGQEATGEVVFTTGMAGYQETLSDPSYHGQIVVFTAAHIGNYGTCRHDDESASPRAGGAVFHELFNSNYGPNYGPDYEPGAEPGRAEFFSSRPGFPHWRAEEGLDARLAGAGVTSITGVDTRALTLHLREHGARNGIISALDLDRPSLLRRAEDLPSMRGRDLAREVTCPEAYPAPAMNEEAVPGGASLPPLPSLPVAVLDFGLKRSILRHLRRQGLKPTVWPADTPAADILAAKPRGVLLSNGPGDPAACGYAIAMVRALLGKVPLFGICLGHQILGLALGAKTYKLPFGHHGVNHPVKDILSGRVCITSQNHGFCVDPETLPDSASPSHWNLNDGTLEGIICRDVPAFSVQFHPEAAPGPTDAAGLFARFRESVLSFEA